jgi:5-methylcytosine-specific restriction enzyme A
MPPPPDPSANPDQDQDLSWMIESDTIATKKTDRPVFLFRETVIPEEIRAFFSLAGLRQGQKRHITLFHGKDRFDAFIEMTSHPAPRTRMMWKADFATVLQKTYPQWVDFFKKSRKDSEDTPSISFVRRQDRDQYDLMFDAPWVHGAIEGDGGFHVPVKAGETVDNDTLRRIFKIGPAGTMRRSLWTNSLVLIADHTTSAFEDKWVNRFFHYTGMGLVGEESLTFHENKTLSESKTNGVNLYLFEVFTGGRYVYMGEVELSDPPFLSRQADLEKHVRDVYIFPLRIKGNKAPPILSKEVREAKEHLLRTRADRFSSGKPMPLLPHPLAEPGGDEPIPPGRGRDPLLPQPAPLPHAETGRHRRPTPVRGQEPLAPQVPEYKEQELAGICQLCERPAPFRYPDGEPYLEPHHLIPLEEGGLDGRENIVALCPNCHRKMHVLHLPEDLARLKEKSRREGEFLSPDPAG